MICPKCGRSIPDGTICPCSMAQPLSSNPAVNTLKTLGSSPLFLVFAILMSLAPLLSILGQMMMRSNMGELMYYAMQLDLDPGVLYPFLNAVSNASVGTAVLSAAPSVLIAVGLWITYASCRSTQSGNVSTAGMTICKVLAVITLVCLCICAALMLILAVILLAAGVSESAVSDGYYSGMTQAVMAMVGVFLVIIAVVFALTIIYEVCVIKTINRIKATAVTGTPDNRIPNFLIVMNYIAAVGSGLAGLGNLFTAPAVALSALASAASLILISILLSKYRSGMTLLMYPPVQPVYPQQPPQGPWA